jgi:hypothetical protein
VARDVRSAPDDPDAAGKDQGKAVGGDDPPDSSRAFLDSALRIERTATYRAAVDAAYRQYAIDHLKGKDRPTEAAAELKNPQVPDGTTEPKGRMRDRTSDFYLNAQLASSDAYHSVAEITPVLVHDADGRPGYATIGTAAEYELTGARGPASGREFDPETAGGPIQQLDAGKERITSEGVLQATAHLQRFTGGGPLEGPEQAMLDRLTSIAAGDMEPTSYDLNFYTHELDEAGRYARLGFGPESGVDLGSPEMYDVWNDVHTAALEDYGLSGADLFYTELAP